MSSGNPFNPPIFNPGLEGYLNKNLEDVSFKKLVKLFFKSSSPFEKKGCLLDIMILKISPTKDEIINSGILTAESIGWLGYYEKLELGNFLIKLK